jgi:hypothetical protein
MCVCMRDLWPYVITLIVNVRKNFHVMRPEGSSQPPVYYVTTYSGATSSLITCRNLNRLLHLMDRDSAVGIATGYGLDD